MTVERDRYLDWLRATSLVVVVLWHWAFTILRWGPSGPAPTSPLGFFSGLWLLTWLLQVLPLFFYVGGAVHLRSWERARERGEHAGQFVFAKLKALMAPAIGLVAAWFVIGVAIAVVFHVPWVRSAVLLVISPLWFLVVYGTLVALVPLTAWLHRRFDLLVLVWLGGFAMVVDVLRLRYGMESLGWANMAWVWGLAFQAGYFHQRLVNAPRRLDLSLMSAGLFALVGLVSSGLYPGSMVGIPGDRMSNIGPPTFVIIALLVFQIGLAEVFRPSMEKLLSRPHAQEVNLVLNQFALPLFLFHTTGMAIARTVDYFLLSNGIVDDRYPDWIWWAERPLAVLGSLLFTLPLIIAFTRRRAHHGAAEAHL